MTKKKTKIDDGFYPNLVKGAQLEGYMGIPMLMDLGTPPIPKKIVPFDKIKQEAAKGNFDAYVGFYLFDDKFSEIITDIDTYIPLLQRFQGAITPDCTLLTGQANCLQATNTYFNRAVGYYLQKHHIQVIPQIRWSDEQSFDYCFLGVRTHSTVAVSTYGCIKGEKRLNAFLTGAAKMISVLEPVHVLVHGSCPDKLKTLLSATTHIHHYKDWMALKHKKDEA